MQIVFTLALFLPPGTVHWPIGWVYVAMSLEGAL
jgi:hypothetical protein